ncbi:optineurin [Drosophila suzukii]|uniref:Optineurin n=1 Tax=Drosophila suzukii TaxID=28584 RepID=A0AB40DI15_DROSZ
MCESKFSDPSSFLYLDMLADILMRDTLEMEVDFNKKMEFIKEQEQKVLENAKNLISMDQMLGPINCSMLKLEMELHENETNLIEAEKAITRLEQTCPRSESNGCRTYPLARATYEDLLSLLVSAEKTAAQCTTIREEIEMYNQEASAKLPPKSVITKIIDYHNNILILLEKEIEKLQCEVTKVQREYEELNKKMEPSKLIAQCPCQQNNDFKPMVKCDVQLRM